MCTHCPHRFWPWHMGRGALEADFSFGRWDTCRRRRLRLLCIHKWSGESWRRIFRLQHTLLKKHRDPLNIFKYLAQKRRRKKWGGAHKKVTNFFGSPFLHLLFRHFNNFLQLPFQEDLVRGAAFWRGGWGVERNLPFFLPTIPLFFWRVKASL